MQKKMLLHKQPPHNFKQYRNKGKNESNSFNETIIIFQVVAMYRYEYGKNDVETNPKERNSKGEKFTVH